MKKAILLTLTLLFSVAFFSCKKSDDDSLPTATSFLKVNIDGSAWTPSSYTATYRYGYIVINGTSNTGETIILRMKLTAGHEMDAAYYQFMYNDDNSVGLYIAKTNDAPYGTNQFDGSKPIPGTITFTKFDLTGKQISGSFDMKVKRVTDATEKTITGSFENLSYTTATDPTPTTNMTASVDGASFTATKVTATSSSVSKTLQIEGKAANNSAIILTVPYKILPGTYNTAMIGSLAAQYNPTSVTYMQAETGSITVSFHDPDAKVIKGKFSFNAVDGTLGTKKVTNGNFVATY